MLLAAMLAMVLVAAAPALAQDATAGDDGTATGGDVTNTETQYQNQAAAILQACGNVTVAGGQYDSDVTVGDITVGPVECQAIINQVQAGEDAVGAVNAVLGEGTVTGATGGDDAVQDDVVVDDDAVQDDDVVVDDADVDEDGTITEDDAAVAEEEAATGTDVNEDGAVASASASAFASAFASAIAEGATEAEATEVAEVEAAEVAEVVESEAAEDADVTVLPDTGGASLFTLGAGALLVGGGLLARRIFS